MERPEPTVIVLLIVIVAIVIGSLIIYNGGKGAQSAKSLSSNSVSASNTVTTVPANTTTVLRNGPNVSMVDCGPGKYCLNRAQLSSLISENGTYNAIYSNRTTDYLGTNVSNIFFYYPTTYEYNAKILALGNMIGIRRLTGKMYTVSYMTDDNFSFGLKSFGAEIVGRLNSSAASDYSILMNESAGQFAGGRQGVYNITNITEGGMRYSYVSYTAPANASGIAAIDYTGFIGYKGNTIVIFWDIGSDIGSQLANYILDDVE